MFIFNGSITARHDKYCMNELEKNMIKTNMILRFTA